MVLSAAPPQFQQMSSVPTEWLARFKRLYWTLIIGIRWPGLGLLRSAVAMRRYGFLSTREIRSSPASVNEVPAQSPLQRIISAPKRPGETSNTEVQPSELQIRSLDAPCEISKLLDVHPLELRFPFERNKRKERPLTLTNRSDHNVVVWIRPTCRHRPEECLVHIDLHHSIIMDPHSTYAVIAMAKEQNQTVQQAHTCVFEVVMVVVPAAEECRITLMSPSKELKLDNDFFGRVNRFGGEVHWAIVTASVVKDDPGASCQEVRRIHKLITELSEYGKVKCIDVHPTETRILVAYETSYVSILNYGTPRQGRRVASLLVTRNVSVRSLPRLYMTSTIEPRTCVIRSAKFVNGGDDWFATGLEDGWVHVYSCANPDMARREFLAHPGRPVTSLAAHPTEPSLLTAADGATSIKLWRWGSDGVWMRAQEFNNPNGGSVQRLTFDVSAFASLSNEGILKVWEIQSPDPIATVGEATYCNFYNDSHRHFLVYGCRDTSCAYIWDMQTKNVVHKLHMTSSNMYGVACHPTVPTVATRGSFRDLYLWDGTTFRLEKRVHLMDDPIECMGSTSTKDVARLVVPCEEGMSILEISLPMLRQT